MPTLRPPQPSRHFSIYNRMQFDNQLFSLPFSTMNHLIENANAKSMKSLQETCKFFYFKRQIHITDQLFVGDDSTKGSSIKWQDLRLMKSKLWLHRELYLCDKSSANLLIPKIFKCELFDLSIEKDIHLTFSDLEILTNSGTIEELNLYCKVYDNESGLIQVPVHRILALVPTIINLFLDCCIEQKAMETFMKEERMLKFQRFELFDINHWLDPNLVLEFVKKNLTNNAILMLNFEIGAMNREFRNAVDPQICSILHEDYLTSFFYGLEMD